MAVAVVGVGAGAGGAAAAHAMGRVVFATASAEPVVVRRPSTIQPNTSGANAPSTLYLRARASCEEGRREL